MTTVTVTALSTVFVQVELESSNQNTEEKRLFGVLTVTSSTSIDHYFATKMANLQRKAKKTKPTTEAVSQMANDTAPTCDVTYDKRRGQTQQKLTIPEVSSEMTCTVACDAETMKQCKKKRQKIDNNCCSNDERVRSKSLDSNGTSKKKKNKKKQRDNDLAEAILEYTSDSQIGKTAETTKKRLPNTTVATELNQSTLINSPSKKRKKSTSVDCHTR